jgi:hypothetical protein
LNISNGSIRGCAGRWLGEQAGKPPFSLKRLGEGALLAHRS